jgi:hypothetical protein
MPTWLGQSPGGDGWRYMHEDGRIEDIYQSALGPDFAPPGYAPPRADPSQTSFVAPSEAAPPSAELGPAPQAPGQPVGFGVGGLEAPQVAPPPPPSAPMGPSSTRSSESVSITQRGPTLPVDYLPSDSFQSKQDQRAAAAANRAMAPLVKAAEAQGAAVTGLADAQALQSDAKALGYEQEAALLRNQQEARAAEVAEISQKAQTWTAEIRNAIDSIPSLDSKRVFKNQSRRESLSMGIAAFMGGFLQPVLGTNAPMDIINQAIDRDLDEQRSDIAQAQANVTNIQNLARVDTEQAMWQLNQRDIERMGYLTAIQRDVQAQVQGYQSTIYKKQGEKFLADIGGEIAKGFQSLFINFRDFLEKQRHDIQGERAQMLSARASMMNAETNRAETVAKLSAGKAPPDLSDRAVRDPATGDVVGYMKVGTPAQVAEHNLKLSAAYRTIGRLAELKKLKNDYGSGITKKGFLTSAQGRELRSVYNDLLSDVIRAKSGVAAGEPEVQRLEQVLPFETFLTANTDGTLDNYVNKVVADVDAQNSTLMSRADGSDSPTEYKFQAAADTQRAIYGTDNKGAPDRSINGNVLRVESVLARESSDKPLKAPERIDALKAAIETAKLHGGAANAGELGALRERIAALPPKARAVPTGERNGSVQDVDALDLFDEAVRLGQAGTLIRGAEREGLDRRSERAAAAPDVAYYQGD